VNQSFALAVVFVGVSVLTAPAQVASSQAELVRFTDRDIVVRINDRGDYNIRLADIHRYRVKDGELHLQLEGGRTVVVALPDSERRNAPSDDKWRSPPQKHKRPSGFRKTFDSKKPDEISSQVPRVVQDRIRFNVYQRHAGLASREKELLVNEQFVAYLKLTKYSNQGVAGSDLFKIKRNAETRHPDDYVTQLYVVETECDAYVALRHFGDNRVTRDVIINLKEKVARDHPDSYSTQLFVLRNDVATYRPPPPPSRPIPELRQWSR
jgi:hypothetical protein